MHTQTIEAANWWARPRGPQAREWVATYQQSLQARHRTLLVELIRGLAPESVLEVGCHCGPNLIRLCETFPNLIGSGVDANAEAIDAGRQWAFSRGLDARTEFQCGRIPEATQMLPDRAVDVVVSCYALAYVAPADLDAVLYEVGRLARHAVVLLEPMRVGPQPTDTRSLSGYTEWAHDYQASIQWVGTLRGVTTALTPIQPPVDRLNAALVIRRCS